MEISSALSELLMGKEYFIEPSPKGTSPLFLLLTLKTDIVGFATLNDEPEKKYSQAYEKIKELYCIHSSEWADFDLTLVLCKTNSKNITDDFCNSIEINSYFCRKFIIDLSKDTKIELSQLPFIPLHPQTIVGLKRPISAQTFLMKHGVSSELARYLVVPHARGIEGIIYEALQGILGETTWFDTEIGEFPLLRYRAMKKVRLKEMEINNFRAYYGNRKFDLDADLVILFGPNGFGKTSFFDAIDFACTGGVARFDERFGRNTERLLNALKHLDSPREDSFVKMTVEINGQEVLLERNMKDRTQACVNRDVRDRTKTLLKLTGLFEGHIDLRIENLIRLFRATHIFGQEYQSLTSEIREHSKLPEDTVSRMLAFQDYVEANNKTKKVSEELRIQIKEKRSSIIFLGNSLKSKEVEIEKLRQSAEIIEEPETVLVMGKEIAEKVAREVNISIEIPRGFNQKIVRDWRVMIEVQIGLITQNSEIIDKLEAKLPESLIHRRNLKEKMLELARKKELFDKLNKDCSEKEKKLEESNEKLKKLLLDGNNLSLKQENLNWFLQTKDEYEQFKEQISKENVNYQNIRAKLLELLPQIEKLKSENKAMEKGIEDIASKIKTLESNLVALSNLERRLDDWLRARNQKKKLELRLSKVEPQLIDIKNSAKVKRDEFNVAIVTEDRLRNYVDNLQQSQSELQTLIDNIERHISNNICPVCGTSHKSREELIERLKLQRGAQPKQIQEALESFEDARMKANELKKQVDDLESKIKRLEQEIVEIQKELVDIKGKIKTYEEIASSLNILTTSENLAEVIDSQKKDLTNQKNTMQQKLSELISKTHKQREELTSFVEKQEGLEQNLRTIESRQSQLQSMIEKIREDTLAHQISLELDREVVQNSLITTNSAIEGLSTHIQMQQNEHRNLQKETSDLLEKRNILEKEIQKLDKEITDSKKYIEEVESLIKRLNLKLDIEREQILLLKRDFVEKSSRLQSLRIEVINFELALDAVQISAALAKYQEEIENINKQIRNLGKEQEQLNNWLSYLGIIYVELESQQNKALKEYTDKYGPLASAIQKRLRSVYGFGEIKLYPEKAGIAIRVERKTEKNIYPSDYFSESQIQIVMISIFLSAALTQTWSTFGSILLDDPVEHFDDLNVYSLLDLIKGLIMESGGHQFIISTCEDRLFRLLQQKFNKLNGRAIFYVFESIGENGPRIKRL